MFKILNDLLNHIKFVRKFYGKIPCRRPEHRWDDDIKIDLNEIGYECMD